MAVERPLKSSPVEEQSERKTTPAHEDWLLGDPESPVNVLEYGDFECPFSAATRPILEELVAEYPNIVSVAFRHFPITTRHSHAFAAAEAAEIAGAQGRFWPMHDLLFTYQRTLELERLCEYAEALGLEGEWFRDALLAHSYASEVHRDFQCGIRDRVKGTPTLFVNSERYVGARTLEMLREAVWAAHGAVQGGPRADGPRGTGKQFFRSRP